MRAVMDLAEAGEATAGAVWVAWWVTAQAVVAEELGPIEGMSRSRQLVKGNWWRLFGIALLITLIGAQLGTVLGVPLFAVGATFTALAGMLLFFDLKARKDGKPRDLDAPERP